MEQHKITVQKTVVEGIEMEYNGEELVETKTLHKRPTGEIVRVQCSCGEEFDTVYEAKQHIDTEGNQINPVKITEIVQKMRNSEHIVTREYSNGFVRKERGAYYLGFDLSDDKQIVVKLVGKNKVRHRGNSKLKTKEVYVVKGSSYMVNGEFTGKESLEEAKKIEYGYTPAYRTDSVSDMVEETFDYYTV